MMLFDLCCIPEIYQHLVTQKMFLNELVRTRQTCKCMNRLVEKNRYSYRQKSNFELHFLGTKPGNEVYWYVELLKDSDVYSLRKNFYFLDPFNQLSAVNFRSISFSLSLIYSVGVACKIPSLDSFLDSMKFRTEKFLFMLGNQHFTSFTSKINFTRFANLNWEFDLNDFNCLQNTKIVSLSCQQPAFIPDLYKYLGQLESLNIFFCENRMFIPETFRQSIESLVSALIMDDERNLKIFSSNAPELNVWSEKFKKEKRFFQLYYGERCHTYVCAFSHMHIYLRNVDTKVEINCVELKNGEILLLQGKEEAVDREMKWPKLCLAVVKNREELLLRINHGQGLFGGQMAFDLSYLVERGFLEAPWEEAVTLFQEIASSFVSFANAHVQLQ